MAVRATVIAQIPTPLVGKWMQHIRDFDTAHEGCHFEIFVATDQSITAIQRLLDNLNPPLRHQKTFLAESETE